MYTPILSNEAEILKCVQVVIMGYQIILLGFLNRSWLLESVKGLCELFIKKNKSKGIKRNKEN
jgi:hypothetical protein